MKFIFNRDAMIREIAIAQEIISNKATGTILSNVKLTAENNTLYIKATDIKINFETFIPVQVEEEGSTTVYCEKFFGILNTYPEGEIEFNQSVNENEDQSISVVLKPLTIKASHQIKSMSQEKFPDFASADDVPYFDVPSKDFKAMIKQTSFAVSEDETRYFMNGVYVEKKGDNLNLVATDGRRLSFISKPLLAGISDFPSAIVHPKILNIISKHLPEEGNISIAVVDKMIFFKFGNYKFGSALLDGQFPNYERVIPTAQEHSFQVDKNELITALKSVATMVDKKAGKIYFNIQSGVLAVSSQIKDMGSGNFEIPCQYDGDTYTIALNYRYIDEPLRVIESPRINFEFTDENKAITIKSEPISDYVHVIAVLQKD